MRNYEKKFRSLSAQEGHLFESNFQNILTGTMHKNFLVIIHFKNVKILPKYNPAGSRNPAREIPQSREIEKTWDLVNCSCHSKGCEFKSQQRQNFFFL